MEEKQYTTKDVYLFGKTTSIEERCPKVESFFHAVDTVDMGRRYLDLFGRQ